MPRTPHPLPASAVGESLTTASARTLGISPDRLRRADVHHPFRGVATFAVRPSTVVDRAWAYTQVMHAAAWFSCITAASLRGLPVPRAFSGGPLHVVVPRGVHPPRSLGVVGHQRDLEPPVVEQILCPLSTGELVPLRTGTIGSVLLTAASHLSLPDLVALVDAARLADEGGTVMETERMLTRSSRRAGSAALGEALLLSRAGVRSRPETHLRLLIARAGLPAPEVAPGVRTLLGVLHPDLGWPEYRVLVEYEGDGHRTDDRVFASDLRRFDAYADADWSAVRCSKADLYGDPRRVLESLTRRLRARGWRSRARRRAVIRPIAVP